MSHLPPSADLTPDSGSGGLTGVEAEGKPGANADPGLPRTVRRRPQRRSVSAGTSRSATSIASDEVADMSRTEDTTDFVASTDVVDPSAVTSSADLVEPELEDSPETEPEPEPEPEDSPEPEPETLLATEGAPQPEASSAPEALPVRDAEPSSEPAPAPQAAPRTGRIEIPVPSIVRARERAAAVAQNPVVLRTEQLTKSYGQVLAAAEISIEVHAGSFTGIVGPNGAGKTTVLSMISGVNRPTSGRITVHGIDVWSDGPAAKRVLGTLPDRLRLFDRLSGAQLLYYAGVLHGVDESSLAQRASELAKAFGLEPALDRPVSDYSAGMQKKIGLACAMIHAPEVLVLDEPFEAIDPVSASNVTEILEKFVGGGGSVIMSSHSLDLIQRVCDNVVVIVDGSVIAQGTVDAVRDGLSLEERFRHLTDAPDSGKGLEWLHGSADSD
ncbi:ABC transporter ATP-binding protein [Leucobacter sp. W1038]|uniref:ABC transporter ATP-binding protein n=1 Tax=Leucobacter sp. W1038 TaxID=3438281 RepID=UPI003D9774F8